MPINIDIFKHLQITPLSTPDEIDEAFSAAKSSCSPEDSLSEVRIDSAYDKAQELIQGHPNLLHTIKTASDLNKVLSLFPKHCFRILIELEKMPSSTHSESTINYHLLTGLSAASYYFGNAQFATYFTGALAVTSTLGYLSKLMSGSSEKSQLAAIIENKDKLNEVMSQLPVMTNRCLVMVMRYMKDFDDIALAEIDADKAQDPELVTFIMRAMSGNLTQNHILAEALRLFPSTTQETINNMLTSMSGAEKRRNLLASGIKINKAHKKILNLLHLKEELKQDQDESKESTTLTTPSDNKPFYMSVFKFLMFLEYNTCQEDIDGTIFDITEAFQSIEDSYTRIRTLYLEICTYIDRSEFDAILKEQLPFEIHIQLCNALNASVSSDLKQLMSPKVSGFFLTESQSTGIISSISIPSELHQTDADTHKQTQDESSDEEDAYYDCKDTEASTTPLKDDESDSSSDSAESTDSDDSTSFLFVKKSQTDIRSHIRGNIDPILHDMTACIDEIITRLDPERAQSKTKSVQIVKDKIKFLIKIKLSLNNPTTHEDINTIIALFKIALHVSQLETHVAAHYTQALTAAIDVHGYTNLTGTTSYRRLISTLAQYEIAFPEDQNAAISKQVYFCLSKHLSPINTVNLLKLPQNMVYKPRVQQPPIYYRFFASAAHALQTITHSEAATAASEAATGALESVTIMVDQYKRSLWNRFFGAEVDSSADETTASETYADNTTPS